MIYDCFRKWRYLEWNVVSKVASVSFRTNHRKWVSIFFKVKWFKSTFQSKLHFVRLKHHHQHLSNKETGTLHFLLPLLLLHHQSRQASDKHENNILAWTYYRPNIRTYTKLDCCSWYISRTGIPSLETIIIVSPVLWY